MGEPVRLNLGCGPHHWPGFINVDFPANWTGKAPDVGCDLHGLPFDDGFADEVHAIHVIEHFYRWEVEAVLAEWMRVLKPGGLLVLELPCLDKVVGYMQQTQVWDTRRTLWALYGDPSHKDPHMCHKWAYSQHMMKEIMENVGLENVRVKEPLYHVKERDMRLIGVKC